jgi:hypothetical protein
MEDILASIRRIISDDDGGEAAEEGDGAVEQTADETPEVAAVAEVAAVEDEPAEDEAAEDEDDILELTEVLDEAPEPEPDPEPEPEDEPEPEPDLEPDFDAVAAIEPTNEAPADGDSAIVSDLAAFDAAASLSDLAGAVSDAKGVRMGSGHKTLEELVKELLRPMLKEWLDDNLPTLVECLVEREINRISGRAEDE